MAREVLINGSGIKDAPAEQRRFQCDCACSSDMQLIEENKQTVGSEQQTSVAQAYVALGFVRVSIQMPL